MFQTGYLTVKEIIYPVSEYGLPREYLLEIPNREVREAFFNQLTAGLTENEQIFTTSTFREIRKALSNGDLQSLLDMLKSLFASIPYQLHVSKEAYYHSIFFSVMKVLGFKINAEVSVANGRIDAELELDNKVYVFEFKYCGCPPEADEEEKRKISAEALKQGMKQITDRGYANKYSGKTVYQAAFAFLGRDNVEMLSSIVKL